MHLFLNIITLLTGAFLAVIVTACAGACYQQTKNEYSALFIAVPSGVALLFLVLRAIS